MRWPWQRDRLVLDDRSNARLLARTKRECRKMMEDLAKAGDPEAIARERRQREGVPIPPALAEKIRELCARCGVPYVLAGEGASGSGA